MAIAANEITRDQVERAMQWAGPPLAELFKSPMTLKPHDLVTMKLSELGHMLAWYAELQRPRMRIAAPAALEAEVDELHDKPTLRTMLLAEGAIEGGHRSLGEE